MRLLLIEDDTHIARELMLRWRDSERLAQHAPTLADADAALAQATFDIVLLDLGLPDGDGMDWLAAYRQRDPQGAVLVMTARDRVADRVKGLRLGADDYLVKPFAPEELDARIDVLVRRANIARTHAIRFGRLDLIQETSEVLLDGKRLDMSPREFELLFILMRAAPRLVTKRALVDALVRAQPGAQRRCRGAVRLAAAQEARRVRERVSARCAASATSWPSRRRRPRRRGARRKAPRERSAGAVAADPVPAADAAPDDPAGADRRRRRRHRSAQRRLRDGHRVRPLAARRRRLARRPGAQRQRGSGANAVDLPEAARTMLAYDEIDHTWFSVEDRGRVLIGSAGIPSSGVNAVAYADGRAFDAVYEGAPGARRGGRRAVRRLRARGGAGRRDDAQAPALQPRRRVAAVSAGPDAGGHVLGDLHRGAPHRAAAGGAGRAVEPPGACLAAGRFPRTTCRYELSPFATALNDLLSRIRGILVRERMFAAAAAHQLRTPLTALRLGMARARNSPDIESARAVLDELTQVTEHTGRLVQQLMLLGRLDPEGRGDIDRVPVDLRDVARDVCGLFAEVALEQHVDLELQLPDAAVTRGRAVRPAGRGAGQPDRQRDEGRGPQGPGAGGRARRRRPRLRVCDSGPGIKPSERTAIFERYARGSRPRWEGTGLGLAIVHDVATLHGATVAVTDGELGGACFTIEFAAPEGP